GVVERGPRLSAPDLLDFGDVISGSLSSAFRVVRVANAGNEPLTLGDIQLTGPTEQPFAISHGCPQTLAPYESCPITLTFSPAVQGKFETTLSISSREPEDSRQVRIIGEG